MADVLVVLFIVGFFSLAMLLIKACDRIVGEKSDVTSVRGEVDAERQAA